MYRFNTPIRNSLFTEVISHFDLASRQYWDGARCWVSAGQSGCFTREGGYQLPAINTILKYIYT